MPPNISIEELRAIEGEVRGVTLQTDARFVLTRYGSEGFEQLHAATVALGCPINYRSVKALEWLPLRLRIFSLLAIQKAFDLSDEAIRQVGHTAPKHSFVVKLMLRFFVSPTVAFSRIGEYWSKHYTVGRLVGELDEAQGVSVVRLLDFRAHPLLCRYLEGYFQRLFEYLLPDRPIEVTEVECVFSGSAQHVFRTTWTP